jgi:hypothetical protein
VDKPMTYFEACRQAMQCNETQAKMVLCLLPTLPTAKQDFRELMTAATYVKRCWDQRHCPNQN